MAQRASIHQSEYPFDATTCSIEVETRERDERRRNGSTGRFMQYTAYVFLRIYQPVEKVGAELKMTTNRAPGAPKSPEYGVFGARSGVEASTEGVFQQAGKSLQHHLALACSATPILSIFRPTLSVFITLGLLDTGTAGGVRHVVPHK